MRPVWLLAAALLLSACGVPPTGVIQSGDPATGIPPTALLYFISDGRLVAFPRRQVNSIGVREALVLLVAGPGLDEALAGVTTALSPRTRPPAVTVQGTRISLRLAADAQPNPTAVQQLICTAGVARLTEDPTAASTGVTVTVTGSDNWHVEGSSNACPRTVATPRAVAPPVATPQP